MLMLKLLVPLLMAVSTCTTVRSEVGFQIGLCDGGDENTCTELEEGQGCWTRDRTLSTTACNEPSANRVLHSSCINSFSGVYCLPNLDNINRCEEGCESSELPEAMWPKLSYAAVGVNSSTYAIDIRWTPPTGVTVPGYLLVIGDEYSSIPSWNRCNDNSGGHCLYCAIQLDNLIPSNWCDGPLLIVRPPVICHHLCPGNCQRCGIDFDTDYVIPHPPRDFSYSVCHDHHNSTYSATFRWESGIAYERPNPTALYYFYLSINDRSDGRISRNISTQHQPVILHNLTLEEHTTYYIRIRQYECACTKASSFQFEIGNSVAACSGENLPESITVSMTSPTPSRGYSATVAAVHTPSTAITSSTTLAPTPSIMAQSNNTRMSGDDILTAAISVVVVVAVVVLIAILLIILMVQRLHSAGKTLGSPNKRSQVSPRTQSTHQLLVLYSWGTSERNQQRIMQCLMNQLAYGIDLVYSAKSEVRGDIPQWVEKQISASNKVLVVCNKQFSKEWQSPGSTHTEGAIVNALKAIITGHINSGTLDKICSKLALVFLKEKHKKLVPSGILHSFKQYMLCEEDSEQHNELLRFISDTPIFHFCPQDEEAKDAMV